MNSGGGQQMTLGAMLLYNKSSKQILLMEAGKELVDVIMGFLTLPMGCVLKLLQGEKGQPQQQGTALSGGENVQNIGGGDQTYMKGAGTSKGGGGAAMAGMTNLYECVEKLEEGRFLQACASKRCLLEPRPAIPWGGRMAQLLNPGGSCSSSSSYNIHDMGSGAASLLFCCMSGPCEFISSRADQKCPKHKKRMDTTCKLISNNNNISTMQDIHGGGADHLPLEYTMPLAQSPKAAAASSRRASGQLESEHQQPLTHDQRQLLNSRAGNMNKAVKTPSPSCPITSSAATAAGASDGFVKPDVTFMITNAFEIFPSSTINSLVRLPSLRSEKLGDLDTLDISVGSEEVLQLLKASMVSTNILNDVFSKYCKKGTTTY